MVARLPSSSWFTLGSIRRNCRRDALWVVEAEGATTTSTKPDLDLLRHSAKKTMPPLLFPWRHGTELPGRLQERKEALEQKGGWTSYEGSTLGISTLTAGFYFHIPFFKLLGGRWRTDLAESCSWAFVQGLAGILSNTYHVPADEVARYTEENDISIEFNYNRSKEEEEKGGAEEANEGNIESDNLLFETRLCNLFLDAHKSGKDQMEVCLASTPTSAQLHSLHALPALSRDLAENHPALFHHVQEERSGGVQGSYYSLDMDRILNESGKIETTLMADVLVHCDEKFWVKDLQSGAIVQGNGDGEARPVVHTIRLERVLTFVPAIGKTMGDWIITDIDDLLDGNRWYTPNVKEWWHSG